MVNKTLLWVGITLAGALILGACSVNDSPVSQGDSQPPSQALDVEPQDQPGEEVGEEAYPASEAPEAQPGTSTGLLEPSDAYPPPTAESKPIPTLAYPAPQEESEVAATSPEEEAPPPKTQLEATPPDSVNLASGEVQLIEFFAFW